MIFKTIVVSSFQTNCYIIGCEQTMECAIIDPGDEAEDILNVVKDEKLNCQKIFLTHCHIDHVGAARKVSHETGALIHLHNKEKAILLSLPVQAGLFGLPVPGKIDKKNMSRMVRCTI